MQEKSLKKSMKRLSAIVLALCMVVTAVPTYGFVTSAADTATVSSKEPIVNETTGVIYEWYDDISAYRVKTGDYYETVPEKADYVFGGWFTDSADTSDAVAGTTGGAWAKFVPEETLSVKAQINTSLKDVDLTKTDLNAVSLRLATSVDSLKYSSVGFEIAMDGNEAVDYPMEEVYKTIKVRDDESNLKDYFVNPSSVFCAASTRFATLRITMIPNTNQEFTTLDISVTPYWITKDGSKVEGIVRSNLLISDELANYADTNDTMNETAISTEASYAYYKGASDKVYFAGTYTKNAQTGNHYGITIRNGGQTREVYYDGVGIKVHSNGSISASGTYNTIQHANDIFVWSQSGNSSNASVTKNNSEVSAMLAAAAGTTHTVVWAIEENVLYGSVNGDVFLRIPMTVLCSDWVDGRYYQLGIASYNVAETTKASFAKSTYAMGKAAYGTEEAPLMVAEKEELTLTQMAYEPITGSYMSGTKTNGYAYGEAVDSKDAIAMEFNLKWQDLSNSRSGAGIYIKSGTQNKQMLFVYSGNNDYSPRIMTDYTSTDIKWIKNRFLSNPFAQRDTANIKVTIYDGTLSVLVNDVTAYQCPLNGSDLFGSNYLADESISLGVATMDSSSGLACFDDLTFYEGQEAVNLKKEKWTFYPAELTNAYAITENVKVAQGSIEAASNAEGTMYDFKLGSAANVWEVTGTMKHGAHNVNTLRQGFAFKLAGDTKPTHVLGAGNGFAPYNSSDTVTNWAYTNTTYSKYKLHNNPDINGNYFANQAADECSFKIVVAYDTAYVWLDGVLAWMLPLTEADYGAYPQGSDYELKLTYMGRGADFQQAFTDIKVKTGCEVDTELLTTLKSANDFDWVAAREMRNLTPDGELVVTNTTGAYSDVWGATSSQSIYMSGTYKMTNDKTDKMFNLSGILISDGTNVRRINLRNYGIQVSSSVETVTAPSEMSVTNLPTSANSYSFLKYTNNGVEYREYVYGIEENTVENSPVYEMLWSATGSEHQVTWAIKNHTLYVSVNGEIALIMPLERLCSEWTAENDHSYTIGVGQWINATETRGTSISNWNTLYGTDADAVLNADNSEGIVENTGMLYDAITGAYVGRYSRNFRGAYGATGKTVGLEAEITRQDKNNNLTCAGISVKSAEGSIQVYTIGDKVRIQKNEKYETENVHTITDLLPEGTITYDANGKCQVTANVENDVLYINYNGVDALQINLGDETYGIPGYVAGSDVQIGICTWNVNEGLALFRNVKIINNGVFDPQIACSQIIYGDKTPEICLTTGTITKTDNSEDMRVYFEGSSQTWEMTGTMKQEDLTQLFMQGFAVRGRKGYSEPETSYQIGEVQYLGVFNGFYTTAGWNDYYTQPTKAGGAAGDAKYYVLSDQATAYFDYSGKRTKEEVDFRLVLVDDTIYLWLDDVLSWRIPLTVDCFGGFEPGSEYELAISVPAKVKEGAAVAGTIVFDNLKVKYGEAANTEGTPKFTVKTNTVDTVDNIAGLVERTHENRTKAQKLTFAGTDANNRSTQWQASGTMYVKDDVTGNLRMGFTVGNGEQEFKFYGAAKGFIVVNNSNGWVWTYSGVIDDKYNLNADISAFFNKDARTKREIEFTALIEDDILSVYFDGVLSWQIPLTETQFGGFTAGTAYEFGVAFNSDNTEVGTAGFKNLTVCP